jgi:hypothetical protein
MWYLPIQIFAYLGAVMIVQPRVIPTDRIPHNATRKWQLSITNHLYRLVFRYMYSGIQLIWLRLCRLGNNLYSQDKVCTMYSYYSTAHMR